MRRRDFIAGGALSLGLGRVRAQSTTSFPRLVWLVPSPPTNPPQGMPFIDTLGQLGWIDGKTIQIERRYVDDAPDRVAMLDARAREVVALKPDVIFTATSPVVDALRRETSTIPIVFMGVNNPLAAGFVASVAHPGGNVTGFTNVEPSTIGKMIELLKQVAPQTRTVALMYGKTYVNFKREWIIQQDATDEAAKTYAVELVDAPVENEADIDRAFATFGGNRTTAVMVLADIYLLEQRSFVVASAARSRVPTIFPFPAFPAAGGLMSYGSNLPDQFRDAAGYVDRILRGIEPGDLPVQMPTKYQLVLNAKTASALGITFPPTLLAIADNVIE